MHLAHWCNAFGIDAMHLEQCTWHRALAQWTWHYGTQCPLAQCTWTWHALGTMHLTHARAHERKALWHNALGRNALGSALAQCTWHMEQCTEYNALGTVHLEQRTWRNTLGAIHLAQQCGSHMHWHIATMHVTLTQCTEPSGTLAQCTWH